MLCLLFRELRIIVLLGSERVPNHVYHPSTLVLYVFWSICVASKPEYAQHDHS